MNKLNTSIYFVFFIFIFSIISCKKDSSINKKEAKVIIDTLPKIHLNNEKRKKLPADYITENHHKIDLFYKKYWDKNKVSGSFLVAKNGQIIFERYSGFSNFEKEEKIDENTPIHTASVTKTLTAAAIMILVNEGKIELDQEVNTILSTFPYPEITVRTLLNHRSGLTNYAYFFDDRKIWDHSKQVTNKDILDIYIKHNAPLDYKPNKRFAYCNTNYAMLALIIEKMVGLNYPEAMKKMIFEPLQMNNTFVIDYENEYKNESQSYKGNYRKHELNHLETVYGDKNIYSTPRDLLKFHQAVSSKKYLTSELVDEIYKGYSYEKNGSRNYGLGMRMMEWKDEKTLYYHNGWWHGNTSSYVDLRDENVVIIALSNKYTTMTYKTLILSVMFGDYPLKLKKDELGF